MLISALKRVFSKFSYTLLAFTVGWFIFSISVFAPNLKLISKVFKSEVVSAKYKINFIFITSLTFNYSSFVSPLNSDITEEAFDSGTTRS